MSETGSVLISVTIGQTKCYLNQQKKLNIFSTFGHDVILIESETDIIIPLTSDGCTDIPLSLEKKYYLRKKDEIIQGKYKELENELQQLQRNLQVEIFLREQFTQQILNLEAKLKKATEELNSFQSSTPPASPKNHTFENISTNQQTASFSPQSNTSLRNSFNRSRNSSRITPRVADEDVEEPKKTLNVSSIPPSASSPITSAPTTVSEVFITSNEKKEFTGNNKTPEKKEELKFIEGPLTKNNLEDGQIIKEGWLEKKGQNRRNWNKRWFILKKGTLSYYKTQDPKTLKGRVSLINAQVLIHAEKNGVEKPNIFAVRNPERDFIMRGILPDDKEEWVQALKGNIIEDQ